MTKEKKEIERTEQQPQITIQPGNTEVLKVKLLDQIAQQLTRIVNALEKK